MKKIIILFTLLSLLVIPQLVKAEGETMQKLYIVPFEWANNNTAIGPKYFAWRYNPVGIVCNNAVMRYGFTPYYLLIAKNITQADHDALILHADVYAFPDNLDQPITDPNLSTFFEAIHIPTNWLTPSTTYRQFLRYMAGMFQFNQRYSGISAAADGLQHSIFDNGRTLESNWNSLNAQEKGWFIAALESFGWLNGVQGNPKLRTLAKQAGDLWGAAPFYLGGFEF